jgi:hypothetical protein
MPLMRRAVRVRLRSNRTLTGRIHITEGQSLATFLTTKLHFLNLTDVEASDSMEGFEHLSVRLNQIVWVEPVDQGLHLSSAALASEEPRKAELHVQTAGKWERLHVQMNVSRETRMSDYLDANPGFIPVFQVRLVETGEGLERVALNHGAIALIRELDRTDPKQR